MADARRAIFQSIADEAWQSAVNCFGVVPRGYETLPIKIRMNDGQPRAPITRLADRRDVDNYLRPEIILIEVTVDPQSAYYAQFAYQLGHELGHVMLNPRRTNAAIEDVATAFCYEVLERMGRTTHNRSPAVSAVAGDFESYRQMMERRYYPRIGFRPMYSALSSDLT